jgi:glycosyltransferase involved in cell wall biosynthesis
VRLHKIFEAEQAQLIQINGLVCVQEAVAMWVICRRRVIWVLISDLYPRFVIFSLITLIRSFQKRVFVSEKMIKYYGGNKDDSVIHEPVDLTVFDPSKPQPRQKERVIAEFALKECFPLIVSVANISRAKGFEYLIEGLALVKDYFPSVNLLIIGNVVASQEKYFRTLKSLTQNLGLDRNVTFVGYVNHMNLPTFLSLAHLFVLSSVHEGTPVSLLEAMAMGKAVVATDVGGISEMIADGETGILVPRENSEALAKAIIALSKDEKARIVMGEKGRISIKSKFSLERCVTKYREIFKDTGIPF